MEYFSLSFIKCIFFNNVFMTYKITVLENPLTTWHQQETRDTVNEIVKLKTEGYGRAFNDPLLVIPLDVFEFVGNHILLYHEDKLVMAYKSVFYHDCKRMNLDFPLHNFVKSGGEDQHRDHYFKFFEENNNKKICYDSHLTVGNEVAKNPELLYECLSILYALAFHYRTSKKIDYTFMLGTYFAGTHKTFQKMGAKSFCNLGPIKLSFYDKRDALIMLCDRNFSQRTIELAKLYEALWNKKKIINATNEENEKAA